MILNLITGALVIGVSSAYIFGWLIFAHSFHAILFIPIIATVLWILAFVGQSKFPKYRNLFIGIQIVLGVIALIDIISMFG